MSFENSLFSMINSKKSAAQKPQYQPARPHHEPAKTSYANPARKAKRLISLLKVHGSRNRRLTMPQTSVRISVYMPNGRPALRISL